MLRIPRLSRRRSLVSSKSLMSTTTPKIPRLPVPDLHGTMAKYLDSIQPVLLQDELDGGPPFAEALSRQRELVSSFVSGPGKVAQARLHALERVSPHNWLNDNFWLKKTYLEWRAPLLINSNWWLTFVNDAEVPEEVIRDRGEGFTSWQIRRAACLVHGILDFKHKLLSQQLYPPTTRLGIWLSRCTSSIFNVCRVPQHIYDTLTVPTAPNSRWMSTVVVMAHDFFYALRVADPETGAPSKLDKIEMGLRHIVWDVLRRKEHGETAIRVGVLSSDGRDEWAKNYVHLRSLSPVNVRSLDAIHECLFVLSLDHWSAPSTPDLNHESTLLTFPTENAVPRSSPMEPSSGNRCPPYSMIPNSTEGYSTFSNLPLPNPTPRDLFEHQQRTRAPPALQNRFFDKPLQLIVERTTRAGACGEHATVDALVPSVVCEWAVARAGGTSLIGGMEEVPLAYSESSSPGARTGVEWERLDFVTSQHIEKAIVDATCRAEKLVTDSDHNVLYFTEFGGDEMQRVSKHSPDAFVQLAMQLAYYRLHGRTTPVYETALTRAFEHGRTETIRSLTRESFMFVRACGSWKYRPIQGDDSRTGNMDEGEDKAYSISSLRTLLVSALRVHSSLTRAALTGHGIDRHLLGLRNVLQSEWSWLDTVSDRSGSKPAMEGKLSALHGGDSCEEKNRATLREPGAALALFEHPIFHKSQTWRLSTSGLSEGWHFRGTGFGAPYPDGYGINYLIAPTSIKFCIDSKHSFPQTSTRAFMANIMSALKDMREICLGAEKLDGEEGGGTGKSTTVKNHTSDHVLVGDGSKQLGGLGGNADPSASLSAGRPKQARLYARL